MKYIITENGIYEVSELNEYATHYKMNKTVVIDKLQTKYILNKSILAQADTIKELCDVYVIVGEDKDTNGNPILWSIRQDIPFFMKYYFNYNDIYAAIWTDKGLIYVAKMNDKGELKLIWID